MADSPLLTALMQLEGHASALETELAQTRAAIAALRPLTGAVSTPTSRGAAAKTPARRGGQVAPRPAEVSAKDVERISKALKDGPVSVAEFCERSGLSRYLLGTYVKRGVVVATGVTNNRRVAWPAGRNGSAKEAP